MEPKQPDTFSALFSETLRQGGNVATQILELKGQEVIAKEETKQAIATQRAYNELGNLQPNLGPNDPSAALKESVKQEALLGGFFSTTNGFFMGAALLLLVVLGSLAIFQRGK